MFAVLAAVELASGMTFVPMFLAGRGGHRDALLLRTLVLRSRQGAWLSKRELEPPGP